MKTTTDHDCDKFITTQEFNKVIPQNRDKPSFVSLNIITTSTLEATLTIVFTRFLDQI